MKRSLLGMGLLVFSAVGAMDLGASEARAQYPGGSVVYETVSPGSKSVTFGEKVKVRHRFGKTITKEKPVRYVTKTAPVVRATRVIQPAPIIQQQVIQPPAVIEERVVQPPPVIEQQVIQPAPVIQTRYFSPYR